MFRGLMDSLNAEDAVDATEEDLDKRKDIEDQSGVDNVVEGTEGIKVGIRRGGDNKWRVAMQRPSTGVAFLNFEEGFLSADDAKKAADKRISDIESNEHVKVTYVGDVKESVEGTEGIAVKNPGILNVPVGSHFFDLPESHYIELAKDKGKPEVMRALENLHRWNKSKHPKIAEKAAVIINKLKKSQEWQNMSAYKVKENESIKESARGIVDEVLKETGGDIQAAIYALEDGEWLKNAGYTDTDQEDVEAAHAELKSRIGSRDVPKGKKIESIIKEHESSDAVQIVALIRDGYVIGATEDVTAARDWGFWIGQYENGDELVSVYVPQKVADNLSVQGLSDQVYSDGYEAYSEMEKDMGHFEVIDTYNDHSEDQMGQEERNEFDNEQYDIEHMEESTNVESYMARFQGGVIKESSEDTFGSGWDDAKAGKDSRSNDETYLRGYAQGMEHSKWIKSPKFRAQGQACQAYDKHLRKELNVARLGTKEGKQLDISKMPESQIDALMEEFE
jgi:hypothetical protein